MSNNIPSFAGRAHWDKLDPADFGWTDRWDPVKHPDLLVPFTFTSGRGERLDFGRTHVLFAPTLEEVLRRIDAEAPGVLDSDPDEGSFNNRSKRGGGGRSFHGWGLAADIEWRDNPMGVANPHGPHALPDNTGDLVRDLGVQWGGLWKSPHDAMHVETHLSPDDLIEQGRLIRAARSITDPLEEVMAMYRDKAAFETALRALVRDEVRKEGQRGFNVRYLLTWTGGFNTMETFMAGGKAGYLSIATRAIAAAKKKAAAAKKAGKR